ncbi:MAG: galactokinase family protein [Acidobacteriota bacterium]
MTGASLSSSLVEHGLDPAERSAKQSLFDLVLAAFGTLSSGRAPRHVLWVPGRLEVFGKHTDYAGGRTIVGAVPRGMLVAASPRRDGAIHIVDARRRESVTLAPAGADQHRFRQRRGDPTCGGETGTPRPPGSSYTGWRHYAEVVARRLAHNFPGASTGADIVIASDLPRASGMSSSSALVVGLAAMLVRLADVGARREWQENITSRLDAAGYYACIENGRTFGTLEGDAGVGTHGGSEDHAAILTGTPGHLAAFAFVPMRDLARVEVPPAWRFVLTPCGVRSSKTGASLVPYNRLSRGTQVLLEIWNSAEPPAVSLGAALGTVLAADGVGLGPRADPLGRLRELVRRSRVPDWSADALERRLEHFVREDARIPVALDACRSADAALMGEAAAGSQADAEALLGNQIPETSALATSARRLGAFASCGFGAGFGGSVWALVERHAAQEFASRWHNEAFVAVPGPPLTEL